MVKGSIALDSPTVEFKQHIEVATWPNGWYLDRHISDSSSEWHESMVVLVGKWNLISTELYRRILHFMVSLEYWVTIVMTEYGRLCLIVDLTRIVIKFSQSSYSVGDTTASIA